MTKDLKLFTTMMVAFLLMVMILSAICTVHYEHFDEPTTTQVQDDYVWQVNKHIRR